MLTASVVVWCGRERWRVLTTLTGLPLLFASLALADGLQLLPTSMSSPVLVLPDPWRVATLALLVDALQFLVHAWTHHRTLPKMSWLRRTHAVHHKAKVPTTMGDAFHTGVTDAMLQLLLPLGIALHCVRPDRGTALTFGVGYCLWLLHLHDHSRDESSSSSSSYRFWMTPRLHRLHHAHPGCNHGHMFTVWDWCAGTLRVHGD